MKYFVRSFISRPADAPKINTTGLHLADHSSPRCSILEIESPEIHAICAFQRIVPSVGHYDFGLSALTQIENQIPAEIPIFAHWGIIAAVALPITGNLRQSKVFLSKRKRDADTTSPLQFSPGVLKKRSGDPNVVK